MEVALQGSLVDPIDELGDLLRAGAGRVLGYGWPVPDWLPDSVADGYSSLLVADDPVEPAGWAIRVAHHEQSLPAQSL